MKLCSCSCIFLLAQLDRVVLYMKSPNICIAQSGLRILCRLHVEHPGQICSGQWGKVVGSNGDGTMGCVDFYCNKPCCKAVYFVPDVQ